MGEIITFYSYKGGTGRTMAMANVGWILAAAGNRVLMVDWDLEAPGLHRYLHPFLHDKELETSTGVIDIVIDFAVQATTPPSTEAERDPRWYLPLADVLRYAISINWRFDRGQLDILPAGQQSPAYAARVNSFNWDNFYERLGGGTFLEALRESMRREYDYVLIDSRTGVSDTSGICTVQMPDQIVVCFTLNRQSIEGAAAVTRSLVDARTSAGRVGTKVFPVPTRVEKAEKERLDAARAAARQRFDEFLAHVPQPQRRQYWDEIEITYQPYYAYEEVLAAFGGSPPETGTMLYALQQIATRLTGRPSLDWTMPPSDKRLEILAQYGWGGSQIPVGASVSPAPPPAPPAHPSVPVATSPPALPAVERPSAKSIWRGYWCYVSYARANADESLHRFVADLGEQLRIVFGERDANIFFDRAGWRPGDAWLDTIVNALEHSRVGILLLSPHYVQSIHAGQEFTIMQRLDVPIVTVPWIPLREELPHALAKLQTTDLVPSGRVQSSGLRAVIRLKRYDDEYRTFVAAVAERIFRLGRPPALRDRSTTEDLASAPNAFAPTEPQARRAGSQVAFGYLVPTQQEAQEVGLPIHRYGSRPDEWRPFYPLDARAVRFLTMATAAQEMGLYSVMTVSPSLADDLREGERDGRVSFLLIDPAILRFEHHRKIVDRLDEFSFPLFRPIIVWPSESDAYPAEDRAAIRALFPRLSLARALPEAHSTAELAETISRELVVMRAEALRMAAVRSAIPAGPLPTL